MYKKALGSLVLVQVMIALAFMGVSGTEYLSEASQPAFQLDTVMKSMALDAEYTADERSSTMGIVYSSASDQRVVDYFTLEQTQISMEAVLMGIAQGEKIDVSSVCTTYSLDDLNLLMRIVEAEAGGEDEDGKLLVANVVLNRVNSEKFPDTISEVVLQQSDGVTQFSPVSSGKIWRVQISRETIDAVLRALEGEDLSMGALYFAARSYADSDSMQWFDQHLTYLFQHGNHEFFH